MKFFRPLCVLYRRNKKITSKWSIALLHAIILLWLSYFLWNRPVAFGGELSLLKKIYVAGDMISRHKPGTGSDVMLINVSYDRMLVPVYDEFGIPMGELDITDRHKLTELFRILSREKSYTYILCDIFLDRELVSAYDSELEKQIAGMPRIVFPHHSREEGEKTTLAGKKSVYASYTQTFLESDFIKYRYLFPGGAPSMALKMWSESGGGRMDETWRRYRINGRTAINSVILTYPFRISETYDRRGNKQIFNLGEDILGPMTPEQIADACRGKIILIGNFFEEDIHSTVAGNMPGILIHYNAYLYLKEGRPVLPGIFFIMLFTVYFLLSAYIVFPKEAGKMLTGYNPFVKYPVLKIITAFLGYSAGMAVICIFSYLFFGVYVDVLVLALWFTLLHSIRSFLEERKNKENVLPNS